MVITGLAKDEIDGLTRLSAIFRWEDCDEQERCVYFAVPRDLGWMLVERPEPFITAAAMVAMSYGERRVVHEGAACPYFLEGVRNATHWFHAWYGNLWQPPEIEGAIDAAPFVPNSPQTGMFLSGGG